MAFEYSKQKKKCHLLCYIYFCWFRNFKGKNRVWPFHTRIISSWSLKSRKFSASFLLLYSLIFSVKRPLAVLLVIKHSAVKAATHFQLYDEEDTTTSTTVFENYSKCRIWIFWILAFFTNFCPIKTDLSGNTVWPQASGFQKLAKMDHFWHF